MQITQYTASGEAHGLINTLTNSVEDNDFKYMKPEVKARLEKEKKEDARLVKVEYVNRKGNHERLVKPYCKYAGEPILVYSLIPGKKYELPLGMVKEVNEKPAMKKRSGLMEVDGKQVNKDGSPLEKDVDADWEHKLIPTTF